MASTLSYMVLLILWLSVTTITVILARFAVLQIQEQGSYVVVLFLVPHVTSSILISIWLIKCFRSNRPPHHGKIFPWIIRIIYISLILGISDAWIAGTAYRNTLFSKTDVALSDGGTRGYVGIGYSLTYFRQMGGIHGPSLWFWYTPFELRWTTDQIGIYWMGAKVEPYEGEKGSRP